MEWGSFTLGLAAGGASALLLTASLITRRLVRLRAAEQRALRQERLAELGALTGGLDQESALDHRAQRPARQRGDQRLAAPRGWQGDAGAARGDG